jgi:cell division protein FtsB
MQIIWRTIVKGVGWIGLGMAVVVVFHLGGTVALRVGQFSPLIGAFIGGLMVLVGVLPPIRLGENAEPWIGKEKLGWLLIGLGIMMWGFGETNWRYYISMGESPFPSTADIGYSAFPLFIFVGLLLQPSSESGSKRLLVLMDSLISMGSILAIAWYLLLGSLAQVPGEANLAKFLGLYYPIADTALLSCVVFLLIRGQGRTYQATARRAGLLLVGLGLCFFVTSDFLFNIQNNASTYVEATWVDLGWPLGLMTIGIAAFMRRYISATPAYVIEERVERNQTHNLFGPTQFIPYILLGLLLLTLALNVLSTDAAQLAIRPVLLCATMGVVALVVARQIFTMWENARLARDQAEALIDLSRANQRVAEQAQEISERNTELERGITHLKDVQAQLANGNLKARANLTSGVLMPLAGSLNLMAERLTRLGQMNIYTQRLMRALSDFCLALERSPGGAPLVVPASCNEFTEINRIILSLQSKGSLNVLPSTNPLVHPYQPSTQPLAQRSGSRTVSGVRPMPSSGPLYPSSPLPQPSAGPSQMAGHHQRRATPIGSSPMLLPGVQHEEYS